ncbi:MAG: AmmeMemoRadiSam system protein B [Solirubrobacterales bacterium]
MSAIRPTAVAGAFYPADPTELRTQVEALLAQARAALGTDGRVPKALIAPHAGYVYSGAVAASAYARILPARGKITRVVLLGPSHRVAYRGLALGSADEWASPLGPVAIDRAAVEGLKRLPLVGELDQAHAQEHSLEVHLPFLQAALGEFQLVPIVAGEAPAEAVATVLDAAWGGPETLIVASTDLSHYLDYEACKGADARTVAAIEKMDWRALGRDSACGRVPVSGLLLAARKRGMDIATLDVRNSGDTAGPKDRVVGYGAWALFERPGEAEAIEGAEAIRAAGEALLTLARDSIEFGLANGRPKAAGYTAGMPGILGAPGAAFVTLTRDGRLRGCIGSPNAWRPLIEDVSENAFKAAFRDPRFPPLTAGELDGLEVSLSVLTPPVAMAFADEADLLGQLRPRIDGLIIEDSGRRALFLPSVWGQIPDPRLFLAHLKQKAGLPADHWSPSFRAARFQAVEVGK